MSDADTPKREGIMSRLSKTLNTPVGEVFSSSKKSPSVKEPTSDKSSSRRDIFGKKSNDDKKKQDISTQVPTHSILDDYTEAGFESDRKMKINAEPGRVMDYNDDIQTIRRPVRQKTPTASKQRVPRPDRY